MAIFTFKRIDCSCTLVNNQTRRCFFFCFCFLQAVSPEKPSKERTTYKNKVYQTFSFIFLKQEQNFFFCLFFVRLVFFVNGRPGGAFRGLASHIIKT